MEKCSKLPGATFINVTQTFSYSLISLVFISFIYSLLFAWTGLENLKPQIPKLQKEGWLGSFCVQVLAGLTQFLILCPLYGQSLGTLHTAPHTWSQLLLILDSTDLKRQEFGVIWWSRQVRKFSLHLCCVCVAFAINLHKDQPKAEPFISIKIQLILMQHR